MSNERVIVTDQEGKSMAQHLASAERELSAFVTAVHQLFGPEQARYAADNWMEELEQTDWISEAQAIDWRAVTIVAAANACRARQASAFRKSKPQGYSK
jgi:hypothetical protein